MERFYGFDTESKGFQALRVAVAESVSGFDVYSCPCGNLCKCQRFSTEDSELADEP
jgi:hypothetical protein